MEEDDDAGVFGVPLECFLSEDGGGVAGEGRVCCCAGFLMGTLGKTGLGPANTDVQS